MCLNVLEGIDEDSRGGKKGNQTRDKGPGTEDQRRGTRDRRTGTRDRKPETPSGIHIQRVLDTVCASQTSASGLVCSQTTDRMDHEAKHVSGSLQSSFHHHERHENNDLITKRPTRLVRLLVSFFKRMLDSFDSIHKNVQFYM